MSQYISKFWFLRHVVGERSKLAQMCRFDLLDVISEYSDFEDDTVARTLFANAVGNAADNNAWLVFADRLEDLNNYDEAAEVRLYFLPVGECVDGVGPRAYTRHNVTDAELAKIIRKELKQRYPGVKFYVRSDSYSMGSSIDVYYDGSLPGAPERKDVDGFLDRFSGSDFDGMQDLKSSTNAWVAMDGKRWRIYTDFVHATNELPFDVRQKQERKMAGCAGFHGGRTPTPAIGGPSH